MDGSEKHFYFSTLVLQHQTNGLFGWLVADGWCWFVLRVEYCWLVAGGWFVLREKYCWLVGDKPSEHAASENRSSFPPAKGEKKVSYSDARQTIAAPPQ
jgi:hypothetical protein